MIPGHISTLDGLRAFAIMMVIFHHCGEYYLLPNHPTASLLRTFVEYLGLGVDLFFVLSGFLITGILLDALGKPYFFKRFYWRRGLRIWPLYYVFLLAVFLVHRRTFSGIGVAPFALYYRNFLGPDRASDIYIGQFWSLCVEEQFYLIWPVVIYFLSKRLRLPLIGMLAAVAYGLRAYFSWRGTDPYVIYRLPFCHMDVLLAGAVLAVLIRTGIEEHTLRKVCWTALLAGIAGLVLVATFPASKLSVVLSPLAITCSALFFGGIVGLCLRGRGSLPRAALGSSFLAAISKRSYAMYVFHLVPLYASVMLLSRLHAMPMGIPLALLYILGIGLVTYGMAWVSWKYLEEPILRLKQWEWFA
ncbi:MAG: acyltransferase family protein [Acidobacteriaceae bacterium]